MLFCTGQVKRDGWKSDEIAFAQGAGVCYKLPFIHTRAMYYYATPITTRLFYSPLLTSICI